MAASAKCTANRCISEIKNLFLKTIDECFFCADAENDYLSEHVVDAVPSDDDILLNMVVTRFRHRRSSVEIDGNDRIRRKQR